MTLTGLYAGKAEIFGPREQLSAISKSLVLEANVGQLGLTHDQQADKRYHGGSEQALHQFSWHAYQTLTNAFPEMKEQFIPGALGENLSVEGMHEHTVCIGDIWQFGEVLLQISGPRIPCWKINHKIGLEKLDSFLLNQGCTGWYYRVLKTGSLALGAEVSLYRRLNPEQDLLSFMQLVNGNQKDRKLLQAGADAIDLDPKWRERLLKKLEA